MRKYVCGIRHKESKAVYGPVVTDDPKHWQNEIRAYLSGNPKCSFFMFPDDYEIVCMEFLTDDENFVALPLPVERGDSERV